MRIFAFRPTTVQMPNLVRLEMKRITVYSASMKTRKSKQSKCKKLSAFKYSKDYVGGGEEYLTFNGTRTNLGNAMEAKVNKCSIGYRALPT